MGPPGRAERWGVWGAVSGPPTCSDERARGRGAPRVPRGAPSVGGCGGPCRGPPRARMSAVGIRLDRLTKRFAHRVRGEVHAARDVSLSVEPGEFVTLLGPSGCGKTTTLRMIAGFEQPDAGRVFIGGEDVTGLAANRRNLGFVFQNYALFPHLTVFENVAYGLRVQRRPEAQIPPAVGQIPGMPGAPAPPRQFPPPLPRGEQHRGAPAPGGVHPPPRPPLRVP